MLPLPRFHYEAPDTVAEALGWLAQPGSVAVSGGTDLVPSMKHRLFEPTTVVSLRRLPWNSVVEADGWRIGAGVTLHTLAKRVQGSHPALAAACSGIATPTIQRMGTVGGNIALDTRCRYYNQPLGWRESMGGCLKKDGTVCHVAPKGSGCYAAHSADTVPVLIAYGADVQLVSVGGERMVPLAQLYGEDGRTWLGLKPGELIAEVILPANPPPVVFRKLRTRASIDYGLLLVAVRRDDAGYTAVINAIGPRPVVVTAETPERLLERVHAEVHPLGTHLAPVPWRKKVLLVEVKRALVQLDDLKAAPRR